jgi:hypothetical protein
MALTTDQATEMQQAVELASYDIKRLSAEIKELERRMDNEDVRKRLFRMAMITGLMVMMSMNYWGFSTVIQILESR